MTVIDLRAEFDFDEIAERVAPYISPSVIAREIDVDDIVDHMDMDDIAYRVMYHVDLSPRDVAMEMVGDVADAIDIEELAATIARNTGNRIMDASEDMVSAVSVGQSDIVDALARRITDLERQVALLCNSINIAAQGILHRSNEIRLSPNDPTNTDPF